jgi:hypothetical protein
MLKSIYNLFRKKPYQSLDDLNAPCDVKNQSLITYPDAKPFDKFKQIKEKRGSISRIPLNK